jgi:DNA-binding CsgD family transcriptional regulator
MRLLGEMCVLASHFHDAATRFYMRGPGADLQRSLTAREREILTLASSGKSSVEIAAIVGISATTTNNHFGRILRKLGTSNRAQAIALALQIGQIDRSH